MDANGRAARLARRGLCGLALTLAAAGAAAAGEVVLIRGGRVLPVEGEELARGDVLVRDGVIEAVAPSLEPPYDAKVIDAAGKVVFPGMVLAHTSRGLDRANESLPVAPFLDVADSLDPSSLAFENALRDGVTAVHVSQGNDTVVAGVGRVVHPLGLTVDAMTVKPASAIKLAVAGKSGFDRVRQRALLRETFAELDDYLDALAERRYEEKAKEEGREVTVSPEQARQEGRALLRDEHLDDRHRRLFQLVQGRLDAMVYVERAQDVAFAVELARERGFLARTTFLVGAECFKAVDELKAAGRPVILPLELVWRERDPASGEERETFVAAPFAAAGIPFALQTNPSASFGERFLWYQAARCVRAGVDRHTALRAITSTPAQILGLGGRLGSIQPGRDADLLLLSGDPLAIETHVETVLIGGQVVYERAKDFRLRRLAGATVSASQEPEQGEKAAEEETSAPAETPNTPREDGEGR